MQMKRLITIIFCTISFSVVAAIVSPAANYTVTSTGVVDAAGELNDDPPQEETLTATEQATVSTDSSTANATIRNAWVKRAEAAKRRK
jgi:hypothetical protein